MPRPSAPPSRRIQPKVAPLPPGAVRPKPRRGIPSLPLPARRGLPATPPPARPTGRPTDPTRPTSPSRRTRSAEGPPSEAPRQAPDLSALAVLISIAILVAILYPMGGGEIALTVDGRSETLHSRAGTVGALLVEQGVELRPGDLVIPPPSTRLGNGDTVLIQRARPVRVAVDGRVLHLRSHGRSALAVLQEAGVTIHKDDGVKVNGDRWPLDQPVASDAASSGARLAMRDDRSVAATSSRRVWARVESAGVVPGTSNRSGGIGRRQNKGQESGPGPGRRWRADDPLLLPGDAARWEIDVLRAVELSVIDDGIPYRIRAAGGTLVEALEAAGLSIRPEDDVFPSRDSAPAAGMSIRLRRAAPFSLVIGEETRDLYARARSISEALERSGEGLVGRDYTIPSADTPLRPHMRVELIRVLQDVLVREVEIPFETQTQPDSALPLDQTQVLRPGEPGLKTQRILITYENGVEIDRQLEEEKVERDPVPQILAYGTKIVWRTVDTNEGPKRYWRHMRVWATSYSAARAGTPKHVPWYGFTRLGWKMRHGIIAVDPRFIPLRTGLYVPGYGVGVAGDTGGGIKRYHIDLGFDDDAYQSWHQWVDVYLLEPLPPERSMTWILP